jgi:hypothetical protein
VINIQDVILVRNSILTGDSTYVGNVGDSLNWLAPQQEQGTSDAVRSSSNLNYAEPTQAIRGELELTPNGIRYNLTNTIPVKGLQIIFTLKESKDVRKADLVFPRASFMRVDVNSILARNEIRVLMYNMTNTPLDSGSGSLFRLPIKISDPTDIAIQTSQVSTDSNYSRRVSIEKVTGKIYPSTYRLEQNYPNPFNNQTMIEYDVPDVEGRFARVSIQIFNLLGERVRTLFKTEHEAGKYRVTWDGKDDNGIPVASGVYYYRMVSGKFIAAKKMMLVK